MIDLTASVCYDSIWDTDGQNIFHQNLEKCSHNFSLLDIWIVVESPVKQKAVTYKLYVWESLSQIQNKIWNHKNNPKQSLMMKYYKWMFNIYHTCL